MRINKGKRWAVGVVFTLICRSLWSLLGGCRSLTWDCIDENGALLGRLVKLPHAAFESVVVGRKAFRKKLIFYLHLRQSQLLSVRRWQNLESDGGEITEQPSMWCHGVGMCFECMERRPKDHDCLYFLRKDTHARFKSDISSSQSDKLTHLWKLLQQTHHRCLWSSSISQRNHQNSCWWGPWEPEIVIHPIKS